MASTGTTNSFRRAARSFPRARSTAKPNQRTHILIRDIPRTALPSDLLRLCSKSKAENVSQVSLQYNRFRPSGRAYITVNDPMHLPSTLKALQSSILGGKMTSSTSRDPPNLPPRNRGAEGRAEAAERGLITGNGPDAGVTNGGRNVVMWGLPSRITQENVRDMLKSFKLAGFEGGQEEMVKLEMPLKGFTSKVFIRMSSMSEAHRLVRKLHMTFYQPEQYGKMYPIHAHVVW